MRCIPLIKKINPALPVLACLIACGLVTSCFPPEHPHSAYLTIHQYAINGDADGMAAELKAHPEELNLPEDDGLTPLHLAAEHCRTNIVLLLLSHGANINIAAKDQATPLHLAAQEGCNEVVTILLGKSAQVNLRDDQKRTPLLRAEQWHQDATAQIIRQHGGTE